MQIHQFLHSSRTGAEQHLVLPKIMKVFARRHNIEKRLTATSFFTECLPNKWRKIECGWISIQFQTKMKIKTRRRKSEYRTENNELISCVPFTQSILLTDEHVIDNQNSERQQGQLKTINQCTMALLHAKFMSLGKQYHGLLGCLQYLLGRFLVQPTTQWAVSLGLFY